MRQRGWPALPHAARAQLLPRRRLASAHITSCAIQASAYSLIVLNSGFAFGKQTSHSGLLHMHFTVDDESPSSGTTARRKI
jgi:hypothetical protein